MDKHKRETMRKYPNIPEEDLEDAYAVLEATINALVRRYHQ